jgi:hypothetical protein
LPKRRIIQVGRLNPGDSLQIESLGKKGPAAHALRLSPEQIAQISRTTRRVPEVVLKVSGGGRDSGAIGAHIGYIGRQGTLQIETDTGETIEGKGGGRQLIQDWNLDAFPQAPAAGSGGAARSSRPKAVHNIVLSMPAKVPPEKVLAAAKVFAREAFALQHRYAMVLHTDTKHPHVHLVVKAEREDGTARLNIYKATLRQWREQFAQALREQGIEANASSAVTRGRTASRLKDPIRRAQQRAGADPAGAPASGSTFLRRKVGEVVSRIAVGDRAVLSDGLKALQESRRAVMADWAAKADALDAQGESVLSARVREFSRWLPPVLTDAQRIARAIGRSDLERASRKGSLPDRNQEAAGPNGRAL